MDKHLKDNNSTEESDHSEHNIGSPSSSSFSMEEDSRYECNDGSSSLEEEEEDNLDSDSSKDSLERKFAKLFMLYQATIELVLGCPPTHQHYVDQPWNNLVRFCEKHPEFLSRMPSSKHMCNGDKYSMAFGAMTNASKQPDGSHACSIQ